MRLLSQKLRNHFNKANTRYTRIDNLDGIIASKYNDFNLRAFIDQKVNRILNIGIGNGLELVALSKIYQKGETEIVGVDVSPVSIQLSHDLLVRNNIDLHHIKLINSNATDLPFPDEYVDIIFMNSLLHEVFSYSPNGEKARELAIKESYRILAPGGILYIEDFAAIDENGNIKIVFLSDFARKFYDYFRNEFRAFKSWGRSYMNLFSEDREKILRNMPVLKKAENSIVLGSAIALELLTHFKIFNNDFVSGLTKLGNKEWIEINERYYPSKDGIHNLIGIDGYVEKILDVANRNPNSKFQLICLKSDELERPNFLDDIRKHFAAYNKEGIDFTQFSSKKMRLLFKKRISK